MNLNEVKKLAEDMGIEIKYLYELSKTSTSLIDLLKSIRNAVGEFGKINIYIDDGRFRSGIKFTTKPLVLDSDGFLDYSKHRKKFYYPLRKEEVELITLIFTKDLSNEIGTTDKFLCGNKYPISIDSNGEYNIGFRSRNSKLVKSLINNMVNSSNKQ